MTGALRLAAIVAVARNGVIGRDGAMPWRLRTDLKRYRRLTMGKPMIMGRKTLDSIGKALDGRDSIVLTRRPELSVEGALPAATDEEALAIAVRCAAVRGADEIAVVGGAEIYRLFMGRLDRLYVTHIDAEPDGDARFPPIDPALWKAVSEEDVPAGEGDSAATRFVVYEQI